VGLVKFVFFKLFLGFGDSTGVPTEGLDLDHFISFFYLELTISFILLDQLMS